MIDRHSLLAQRVKQGRWFIVALLLALASALVPAVLTSGLPSTRATGSAFDPATSIVALRGRMQTLVHAEAVLQDPGAGKARPTGDPHPLTFITIAHADAARAAFGPDRATSYPDATPRRLARHTTQAQPRAPPLSTL
jgi:hypothetical protein